MPRSIILGPNDCALLIRAGKAPELFMAPDDGDGDATEAQLIVLGLAILLNDRVKREWLMSLAIAEGKG